MHHNLRYMDLGDYTGPRDLSPAHVQAIINRPKDFDQHILDRDDYLVGLEREMEDAAAEDALEAEQCREYLRQQPCYDDKDYR